MLTIALTGGIGSGKSTVAKYFAELKVHIVDADVIAHALMQTHTTAFKEIVQYFGKQILKTDGTLNRKRLLAIVVDDDRKRQWLERLLHPLIYSEMRCQIEQFDNERANTVLLPPPPPYCIAVIPLLFETAGTALIAIDRILVVSTTVANQIQRVAQRNDVDITVIAKIMNTQTNDATRLAQADDIIYNNGSISELHQQVIDLHNFYLKLVEQS